MFLILLSWLLLLVSLLILGWILFVKVRGELSYWIRPVRTDSSWAVGRTLSDEGEDNRPELLPELNAFLRTQDRSTNTVLRQWDSAKNDCFLGLVTPLPIDLASCEASGYELRELPAQSAIRLSGTNRLSEETPSKAIARYTEKHGLPIDLTLRSRLSGQSFSLYQWTLPGADLAPSFGSCLAEKTLQLRNILVFPIVLTLVSLGLLGTRQPILFYGGLFLIIFLSGACKFVFMYQSSDEAEEGHLQNY